MARRGQTARASQSRVVRTSWSGGGGRCSSSSGNDSGRNTSKLRKKEEERNGQHSPLSVLAPLLKAKVHRSPAGLIQQSCKQPATKQQSDQRVSVLPSVMATGNDALATAAAASAAASTHWPAGRPAGWPACLPSPLVCAWWTEHHHLIVCLRDVVRL